MKEKTLTEKAVAAMDSAVRKVLDDHRRRNRPVAVWQDGKVVLLPPDQALAVCEERSAYDTKDQE